jgi:hypothetical protein
MDFMQVLSFLLIYILIPIAVIVAIVFLIILLHQATLTLKTYDKVGKDLEVKLDVLQGPVDAIGDLKGGYDRVMGIFSSFGNTLFGRRRPRRRSSKREARDYED